MEKEKKILGIKNFTLVVVISSIMLALCTILAFGTVFYGANNAEGDWQLTGEKTTTWIDPGDYTKGKVEIVADITARERKDQNVLFIGTLCGAHGLSLHTIEQSLTAAATYANVDYYFYTNNDLEETKQINFNGTLNAGEVFKPAERFDSYYYDVYSGERQQADGSWNTSLKSGKHQALGDFLECIDQQTSNKNYDFIVLEFDGTRICDWYRNEQDSWEKSTRKGDYPKYFNETGVANKLLSYYQNKQIIWITDNEVTTESVGYRPNRYMEVGGFRGDAPLINYNSLKALLCPDLYIDTTEWEKTSRAYAEEMLIEADPTCVDPVDNSHVLGSDRQVGYIHSDKVAEFLRNTIEELYTYTVNFKDVIDVDDNITFSKDDISVWEYSDTNEWVNITDSQDYKIVIDDSKISSGNVICTISSTDTKPLQGDHKFKIIINFEDKGGGTSFIEQSVDGNPNDGAADITVTPGAGGGPTPVKPTIPEEKALDWPINIKYKVEDKCVDKDASVSNNLDEDIPSIPTDVSKKPEGSNAIGSSEKYVFVNWTLGEDGPEVSPDPNFKPEPDKFTNRYHAATYVAHFAPKYSTIKYEVQGAEIEEGSGVYVIPDDSVKPKDELVDFGKKDYVLQGQIPTTNWTTSDGTAEGIPGSWTFKGNCWYTDQKYDTVFEKIDEVTENEYVAYGKWEFTPSEPSPEVNAVKIANFDDEITIAKPGDTIEYKINITNKFSETILNITITDNVNKTLQDINVSDDGSVVDNVVTWKISSLEPGASKEVSVSAKIPVDITESSVYSNTAIVSSDASEFDPINSNTTHSKVEVDTPGPGPDPDPPTPTPDPGPAPTPGGNSVSTGDIVSGTALLILAGLFVAGMFIIRIRNVKTKERG